MNKFIQAAFAFLWVLPAQAQFIPIQGVAVTTDTPPPVAQEAGFTTHVGHYDFSAAQYADPNTNWLDCNNNDPSKIWHTGSPGVASLDCNIHQKLDGGSKVMNVHLDISHDAQCQSAGFPLCSVSMETGWGDGGNISSAGVTSYPNKYYETVARIEGTFSDTRYNSPQGVWEWWQPVTSNDGGIEGDVVEFQYDSDGYANDGAPNWGSGGCNTGACVGAWWSYAHPNNLPPGWTPTGYHSYGMLTTSDRSSDIQMCWFVDRILQGSCHSVPLPLANEFVQRHYLIMTSYASGNGVPMIASRDLDVKSIDIWSCAAAGTSANNGDAAHMCNGSVFSTDANGVQYWH